VWINCGTVQTSAERTRTVALTASVKWSPSSRIHNVSASVDRAGSATNAT